VDTRWATRDFALLLAISTLGTTSSGMVAPVLPRFAEGELAGGATLVGVVVGLAPGSRSPAGCSRARASTGQGGG
jgi:hypothetical protein